MVGVAISLFQALTQIQEMTLVFVPKILAIFVAMLVALPFMGDRAAGPHDADRRADRERRMIGGARHRRREGRVMRIDILLPAGACGAFMLMFARIGTMVMLMPGIGEMSMPVRVRLAIALVLTRCCCRCIARPITSIWRARSAVLLMLAGDPDRCGARPHRAAVDLALQVAGAMIAQQMGLGFVTAVDPTQGQQGMLIGNLLAMLGVALIFATDLHHLVIAALNDSYRAVRARRI